jgi:succinate-acetate transporter protein
VSGPIHGPVGSQEAKSIAGHAQARIADPIPLGLAGFAAATFTASTVLAGWFSMNDLLVAIPVLIVFGGVTQFMAGMWAYARSNVLATVAFCTFGAFNVSFALLLLMQAVRTINPISVPGSDQAKVAGVFVLMFALISGYLAVAALADNLMIALILGVLALAYLGDGTGLWIGGTNIVGSIGGYAGIVSSLLAFYLSAAIVFNAVRGKEVIPTFSVTR